MKLRVFISILFIIATTALALHEIEHIHNGVDNSTCQICIVDHHSVSANIIDDFTQVEIIRFDEINSTHLAIQTHTKDHAYQTRAPPLKS
nr:hypothetical protein [uncultured Sulfurimonas sp.]